VCVSTKKKVVERKDENEQLVIWKRKEKKRKGELQEFRVFLKANETKKQRNKTEKAKQENNFKKKENNCTTLLYMFGSHTKFISLRFPHPSDGAPINIFSTFLLFFLLPYRWSNEERGLERTNRSEGRKSKRTEGGREEEK